jgi:hypothetical protein
MKVLNIKGAEDTPSVFLDKTNGIFEISGRSLPEDAAEFYKPISEWVELYGKEPNAKTEFVFKLEYFNTASSKLIQDLLTALDDIQNVTIIWYFHEDDESMEESGQEFSELINSPFEFRNL